MPSFAITRTAGIAQLRFNRPAVANALHPTFWTDFVPALAELDRDGQTRALVISGEGRHFCGGVDVAAFGAGAIATTDTAAARMGFYRKVRGMQDALSALESLRFPVIAAIQGACIGAGLELAAACDLRFASQDAYFRIDEINIGVMANLGALQRLPRLMPEAIVKELAFLGTTLAAPRAAACGFVNAVSATAETALAAAQEAAAMIAAKAPLAIAGTKDAIAFARGHTVAEALERSALMQSSIWNPADIAAAMTSRASGAAADFSPLAAGDEPPRDGF